MKTGVTKRLAIPSVSVKINQTETVILNIQNKMTKRIEYHKIAPKAISPMRQLEAYLSSSGLEPDLRELVKLRASQINGCAYCIDMHTKDARANGETEQRLYALSAWRETPFYSDRERAALAWTEAITLISENHIPDSLYHDTLRYFTEEELVALTMAVITINGWNRLAISFGSEPGTYEPVSRHQNGEK